MYVVLPVEGLTPNTLLPTELKITEAKRVSQETGPYMSLNDYY
jgi:hypothetical protein